MIRPTSPALAAAVRAASRVALLAVACLTCYPQAARAQDTGGPEAGWSGNFAINPGFEEDFVNRNSEAHVLSFKGDWYYNQKDLIPDYWNLGMPQAGNFTLLEGEAGKPHGGTKAIKLAEGQKARQTYPGAVSHEGGSAWAGPSPVPLAVGRPERFKQTWRASVWCRGGGTIRLGGDAGASATAPPSPDWQQITVELPPDKNTLKPADAMTVELIGPGEFDDVVVREKLPDSPNLLPNAGFEQADAKGYPAGWSPQRKWRAIGPTYYVWTDWNHHFRENRGAVTVDPLIAFGGKQSLRIDVYPGDEKYIESDAIPLNQAAPELIEVAGYVRADRARIIDIRCVDEEGVPLPAVYPILPEYGGSNESSTFGSGTFGWRYVRKFFGAPPQYGPDGKPAAPAAAGEAAPGRPVKSIRVRLAARGFNAHTLDDAGTRSYASQVGTVWWDNLRVTERTSDAAALAARGAKAAPDEPAGATGPAGAVDLSLGERLYGQNKLALDLTPAEGGTYRAELTTTLPGGQPVTTKSADVQIAKGARGRVEVPYEIKQLAGDLKDQGELRLQLFRDNQPATDTTYAFNTWPVIVDIDVARHYNLPNENPVTTSINLGVAADTLAKVARLEMSLAPAGAAGGAAAPLALPPVTDLKAAFAQTVAALPKTKEESYEFGLPAPPWWVDRTNLLITKLDLSSRKVYPHDNPTRDTVLHVRGVDAGGNVLFEQRSDPFCRVEPPPSQPPIQNVAVRAEDGAVLINGQPRFLTGATHQNTRIAHDPPIIAQLGLMGHRLYAAKFEEVAAMWQNHKLYALQIKPVNAVGADSTTAHVELTEEQKQALAAFTQAGGMQSVVSINTGGWESHIPDDPVARQKHQATNDWIRQTTGRPIAWSWSGGYNAYNASAFPYYDINHAETEMWGPMDYNVIYTPYMKKLKATPSTWVYLPQLYENHPYGRYRFETYENIIRGSAGVSMIQGIGDPTFNRGLAAELRYLESRLYSQEKPPAVTLEPNLSHKVTRHNGKTYILATNAGPITIGRWTWDKTTKHSGQASHEGDSANMMWQRPAGLRLHGFRGLPMPELIQSGDKIVQYVWLDAKALPEYVMVLVRGDGKFTHNGVLGAFDYNKFRDELGNLFLYSELNHSVWHEINWVLDQPTYERAVKLMGKDWADATMKTFEGYRATVDRIAHKAEEFHPAGPLPAAGKWHRIELDADKIGLTGKLVDGFAYLAKNGRALWDHSALERGGKVVRVFSEDTVGIDRAQLAEVKISVPGLKAGTKVKPLFEDRTIDAAAGGFTDNFEGEDTYGYEYGGVEADMFGYVKDVERELPRMMPSGYGYSYGPTAVRIYEIEH